MAYINFPPNPVLDQLYIFNDVIWKYNGYAWVASNGFIGTQGPTGAQGNQGNNGSNGSVGATGPQGFQGNNGSNGSVGATGPQGFQGNNGSNGSVGATGAQGFQGDTGLNGLNGVQGPQGLQGDNGSNGLNGDQGPQGPQGFQGAEGPFGPDGLQGPQGPISTLTEETITWSSTINLVAFANYYYKIEQVSDTTEINIDTSNLSKYDIIRLVFDSDSTGQPILFNDGFRHPVTEYNGGAVVAKDLIFDGFGLVFFDNSNLGNTNNLKYFGSVTYDMQSNDVTWNNGNIITLNSSGTQLSVDNSTGLISTNKTFKPVSLAPNIVFIDGGAGYIVTTEDHTIICNAIDGDIQIDLPDKPTDGQIFVVKKYNNSNNVTVTGTSRNLDDTTPITLNRQYETLIVQYIDSITCYLIIGKYLDDAGIRSLFSSGDSTINYNSSTGVISSNIEKGSTTLASGTKTISNSNVATSSVIIISSSNYTDVNSGDSSKCTLNYTVTPGTGDFTINALKLGNVINTTDVSSISYIIYY